MNTLLTAVGLYLCFGVLLGALVASRAKNHDEAIRSAIGAVAFWPLILSAALAYLIGRREDPTRARR